MRSVSTIRPTVPLQHRQRKSSPNRLSTSTAKIPSLRFYTATITSPAQSVAPSAGPPIRRSAAGRPPPRLKREDATLNDAWLQNRIMEEKRQQGGGNVALDPNVVDLPIRDAGLGRKQ